MIDLIVRIAREKLGCDFNYNAASKFLKECLNGIEDKYIDDILFGIKTAIGNDSGGELIDKPDDTVLNYKELYTVKLNEINKYLLDSLSIERIKLNIENTYIDFQGLVNYYENGEDPFEDIDSVFIWTSAISSYTDNRNTLISMIDSLQHFDEPELLYKAKDLLSEVEHGLTQLKGSIEGVNVEVNEVSEYITNELRLNELKSINPTKDYCDAGYIALNGDYYGLNGKVANFLHLRIADLLVKQESIPYDGNSSDYLIEKNGYIKQHDNRITAFRIDEKFLTQKQLNTVINIVSQKWNEITFDFGSGDWTISIDKAKQLNSDELEFEYKRWH